MKLYDFAKAHSGEYSMLWYYVSGFFEKSYHDHFAYVAGYLNCLRETGILSQEDFDTLDYELYSHI